MALLQQLKNGQTPSNVSAQPSSGMAGGQAINNAVQNPVDPLSPMANAGAPGGEQASPEEQQNYESAVNAMGKLVYGTKQKTSNTIADSIVEQNKTGSLIQTGLMLLDKVDSIVDLNPAVIPELIGDAVQMLTDVAEQKNGIQFTQDEADGASMGIFEAIMSMIGGDQPMDQDFSSLTENISPEELQGMTEMYRQKLQAAKGSQDQQQPMNSEGV